MKLSFYKGTQFSNVQFCTHYSRQPAKGSFKSLAFKLKGFLVQVKGRLRGARRKRVFKFQRGKIPTSTLDIDLPYFYSPVYSRYGVCSVKIWYFL